MSSTLILSHSLGLLRDMSSALFSSLYTLWLLSLPLNPPTLSNFHMIMSWPTERMLGILCSVAVTITWTTHIKKMWLDPTTHNNLLSVYGERRNRRWIVSSSLVSTFQPLGRTQQPLYLPWKLKSAHLPQYLLFYSNRDLLLHGVVQQLHRRHLQ